MRYLVTLSVVAYLAYLAGCSSKDAAGVTIDKSFRPLIPPDTKTLVGIQFDRLKATSLYQRHQKELDLPMLQVLSEKIGLDPRRDLSDLLIAWNGERPLLLARGRFNPSEVERKVASLGTPRITYKKYQLFGDGRNSLAFLNKDVVLGGSSGDVQKAIDLVGNGADAVPEELQARLRQVPKADQVWIVSRGGLPFADVSMRSDIESALSNIVNFITGATAGLEIDSGAHVRIDITCISEKGASRVHDAIRGGIGLARLSTKTDQQDLLRVYDAINVDADKSVVHVRADYPAGLTDKLLDELGQTA